MNYPAASCEVSEEVELFPMQLLVFATLILDVLLVRIRHRHNGQESTCKTISFCFRLSRVQQ